MKKKNFLTIFAGYVRISPKLLWGLVFFAVILLLAVLAPVLSPYDPYYLSDDLLVAPLSGGHLLGTTYMGEDVLSMILYGGRTSLKIGIIAAALSGAIGVVLGALAGFFGGIADKLLTEVTNIFLMIPSFFLSPDLLRDAFLYESDTADNDRHHDADCGENGLISAECC